MAQETFIFGGVLPGSSIVVCAGLIVYLRGHDVDFRGRKWLIYLISLACVWSVSTLLRHQALNPLVQRVLLLFTVVFSILGATIWYQFATTYSMAESVFSRAPLDRTSIVGGLLIYTLTNPLHQTILTGYTLAGPNKSYLVASYGEGLMFLYLYCTLLSVWGIYNLISISFKSETRLSSPTLVVAGLTVLVPIAATQVIFYPMYSYGVSYVAVAITPALVAATTMVTDDSFVQAPVSQQAVLNHVSDEVVVVNHNDVVTELSVDSASEISITDNHIGEPLDEIDGILGEIDTSEQSQIIEADRTSIERESYHGVTAKTFAVQIEPLQQNGHVVGQVITLQDITELRGQKNELERQNQQLEDFSQTVTHNIRNPLTVLYGTIDEVHSELHGLSTGAKDPSEVDFDGLVQHTDRAMDSADKMETVVSDIIKFAEQGKSVTNTAEVSVAFVAGESWDATGQESRPDSLTVRQNAIVLANRQRLKSIFEHLFRATAKASETGHATIRLEDDELVYEDSVPRNLDSDAHQVLNFGYTTSVQGDGVGLPIVCTIAEAHGWTVSVSPDFDDGMTVSISGVEVLNSGSSNDTERATIRSEPEPSVQPDHAPQIDSESVHGSESVD